MISALLFLILSLLAFSSVIIGVLLSYYVKEELTSGAKYFKFFQDGLILFIAIIFLYFNQLLIFFILVPVMFFVLRFIGKYQYNAYFGMLALLLLSYMYNGLSFIWTFVFLYGFFLSAVFCSENQKLSKKKAVLILIKNNWSYLLASLIGSSVLLFL